MIIIKKIYILIAALVLLVACGNKDVEVEDIVLSDELEEFISTFNTEVDNVDGYEQDLPELEKIKQSEIDQPRSEGEGFKQSLLKFTYENTGGFYEIIAIYDSNEELTGYRMVTQGASNNTSAYLPMDDRGKMLGAVIADSLGLGIDEYYESLNSLLDENKESGSYSESWYDVYFDIVPKERTLTVNFDRRDEVIVEPEEEPVNVVEEVEDAVEKEDNTEGSDDKYNTNDIKRNIEYVVNADLDNTSITDVTINEDASVDEERYIVLVGLEWDIKNKPKTTKEMLDMYSDHLAASLSESELIYELVLFWTVPYHNKVDSILKRTYENTGDGMFMQDEMKDITVFD